LSDHD